MEHQNLLIKYSEFLMSFIVLLFGAKLWGITIYPIVFFLAVMLIFLRLKTRIHVIIFGLVLCFNAILDPTFERFKFSALFIVFLSFIFFGQRLKLKHILTLVFFEVFLYWYIYFVGSLGFIEFPAPLTVIGIDLVGLQFGNPNNLGYFFFLTLCIVLHNRMNMLISLMLLASLFLVGSRGLLLLALILFLFVYVKLSVRSTFRMILALILIGSILYPKVDLENYTYLFSKYSQMTEYSVTSVKRFDYLKEWITLSWLPFGKSYGEGLVTAPHNFLVELTFLLGIWPLIIFIILKKGIPLDWRILAVFVGGTIPSTVIAFPIYGLLIGKLLSDENNNNRSSRVFRFSFM